MIPNGFTFSRPVELALSLGDKNDFSLQFQPTKLCLEYCGGVEKINELLTLLKQLARESNYFSFFEEARKFYNPILKKTNEDIEKYPFIKLLENEYGKEQNTYNYVLSSLMKANYGIHFLNKDTNKADMFSVFATDEFSLSPAILFHEYSHPFINHLTEKYSEEVARYHETYKLLKQYKLPDYQSGYGDWNECINEHFVRAMTIHLLRKCHLHDEANELLNNDLYCGYKFIPLILEKYNYYDKNRNVYNDFDSYYLQLLNVFGDSI